MHVLLLAGNDRDFVWITDRAASVEGGYASVEKITHFREHRIACSVWGDQIGLYVRAEFLRWIESGNVPLSDRSEMNAFLVGFATDVINRNHTEFRVGQPRGFILAVLGEKPDFYHLVMNKMPPAVVPITDQLTVGDESNPALFFCRRYYKRSRKTVSELLAMGIHTMRMAEEMNTKGIQGVDAWVFKNNELRQLTDAEIKPHARMSANLDALILRRFARGGR